MKAETEDMAPVDIFLKSLLYPVVDYALKYPGTDTVNYAKGEIEKLNLANTPEDIYIGRRYLGDGRDEMGEYDTIYVYIGRGWFKLISKVY